MTPKGPLSDKEDRVNIFYFNYEFLRTIHTNFLKTLRRSPLKFQNFTLQWDKILRVNNGPKFPKESESST